MSPSPRPLRSMTAGLVLVGAACSTAPAATITVDSAADPGSSGDGLCTLREAITAVNAGTLGSTGCANTGAAFGTGDEIDFAIGNDPGTVQTIALTSALPALAKPVTIDGYTQPGASANTQAIGTDANLRVEIDASAIACCNVPLYINTDGATIRGLVLNHAYFLLWINGHDNNTIAGNYIGTDPTGNTSAGSSQGEVLIVVGNSNLVGGASPADRNVVTATPGGGSPVVRIAGTGNVIQGNYVGVSADGTSALQTASVKAIELDGRGPAADTLIAGNVIYGQAIGIHVSNDATTTIQGNYIGTDATGTYAVGAGTYGIEIIQSTDTTIGGGAPGAGNVIGGYSNGIHTYLSPGFQEPGTIIQGNRIGIAATDDHGIANSTTGISIDSAGVDTDLTPTKSMIGGGNPGEGNTIAYNCGAGITFGPFDVDTHNRWPILGNSIYSNRGLGITLTNSTAPLANDPGDADTGANNRQNYPTITSAPIAAGSVSISGTLNSTPNTPFRLEFFSGIGCHASGNGEGRHFLGSHDVMTDGSGDAIFNSIMFSVPAGHSTFTATATDPDGNTSEFSQCFGTPDLLFGDGFDGGCSGSD